MTSLLSRRLDKIQAAMPKVDENKAIKESNFIYRIEKFKAERRGEPFTINRQQEETTKLMKSGALRSIPLHKALSKQEILLRVKFFKGEKREQSTIN